MRFSLDHFVLIELCRQLAHIDKKTLARQDAGINFPVELGQYICHSVLDALNLEVDLKKLNLQHYVARPNFDRKGYAQAHLSLKENFPHVSQIEDFWEDYGDEFKFKRRTFSRFTIEQIIFFHLRMDIIGIVDDGEDLIDP